MCVLFFYLEEVNVICRGTTKLSVLLCNLINGISLCLVFFPRVVLVSVMGAPSEPLDQDFEAADVGMDDYDEEEEMGSSFKKPNFTSIPQHFRVRLGDAVRLPCEVDELGPGYTLLWKREEGDILTAGSVLIVKDTRISHEGNSLIIRNISLADQGSYICQISTQDQRELRHVIDILGIFSFFLQRLHTSRIAVSKLFLLTHSLSFEIK